MAEHRNKPQPSGFAVKPYTNSFPGRMHACGHGSAMRWNMLLRRTLIGIVEGLRCLVLVEEELAGAGSGYVRRSNGGLPASSHQAAAKKGLLAGAGGGRGDRLGCWRSFTTRVCARRGWPVGQACKPLSTPAPPVHSETPAAPPDGAKPEIPLLVVLEDVGSTSVIFQRTACRGSGLHPGHAPPARHPCLSSNRCHGVYGKGRADVTGTSLGEAIPAERGLAGVQNRTGP